MAKPADIPQRVWDEAFAAMPPINQEAYETSPFAKALHLGFARAILAAEQREREACAWVAEQEIYSQPDDDYQLGRTESAMLIRSAIRNRSQDQ